MILLLLLDVVRAASYADGQVLFTETIRGSCDTTQTSYYSYDYQKLGGAALDSVSQVGIGFWLKYMYTINNDTRTTNPSVPTWSTNVQTENFAYFLSDKPDTQINRILSLSF